jgi:hypothetical protein
VIGMSALGHSRICGQGKTKKIAQILKISTGWAFPRPNAAAYYYEFPLNSERIIAAFNLRKRK